MTNNRTPDTTVFDDSNTILNTYKGGVYQQAASALTYIDSQNYNDSHYASYGFEWWSDPGDRDAGYITWFSEGQKSWSMNAASMGPDPTMKVSQRLISEEPHVSCCVLPMYVHWLIQHQYIIMNLGMSPGFQAQDYAHLRFPAKMYIDYVRIYQRESVGEDALTCDPKNYPTARYINEYAHPASLALSRVAHTCYRHITAYTNPNLTTWAQANQTFPRNSLYNGCY
jgi:beta-glucanase (GH16 family)